MLIDLHVKNIALIDELDVEFGPGLNILTGETGAGKSIILGAVNLALGKKMTSDIIGKFGDYALVELIFSVETDGLLEELKKRDIIPEDNQIILSRKIMAGRSICKINSETCTAGELKEVASLLLDVHGQHEHQKLLVADNQLQILDEFASEKVLPVKAKTAECWRQYKALDHRLKEFGSDKEERMRRISFLEFEIDEIENAQLTPQEDEQLEKQYRKLTNRKKIAEAVQEAHQLTGYENRAQAGELVSTAIREISSVQGYDENLDALHDQLLDIESMLNDFNRELSSYLSELTFSEEEFYEIDQRLNLINGLKAKYGTTIEAILEYQADREKELAQLLHFEETKEKLQKEVSIKKEELAAVSEQLSQLRKTAAFDFEQQLMVSLGDLNFADVAFAIQFQESNNFSENGKDSIEFMISLNPGEAKKPLDKVVSGGELSRIMLAVKTLIADMEDTQTQIFDEIDTGISGRTAQKVAEKMALIGRRRQVLCITHLPQIAAMSDAHFEIRKSINENVTTTQIFKLSEEQSIEEIARILGGAQITQSVLNNAREMKELARVHKNTRVKK